MNWQDWRDEIRERKAGHVDPVKLLETQIHQDVMGKGLREVGRLQAGESVPMGEFAVPAYATTELSTVTRHLLRAYRASVDLTINDFGSTTENFSAKVHDEWGEIEGVGEEGRPNVAALLGILDYQRKLERKRTDQFLDEVTGE